MATALSADRREQTRARDPDSTGVTERDGGQIAWESYGAGDPPIVFVPPWQIVHSRIWKAQIPDFARRHRVIAWDARGNGDSDRPQDPSAHAARERAANLLAVMDAVGLEAAVLVGLSSASTPILIAAAEHPERAIGLVFICPATPLGAPTRSIGGDFEIPLDRYEGWAKRNIHYWRRDYRDYLEHFFANAFPEPHSTKQIEDGVDYGLDTDPESLAATVRVPPSMDREAYAAMCRSIRTPTLVIQGTDERISDVTQGEGLAATILGARLVLLEGAGHIPSARDPVAVNLAIREFVGTLS